MHIIVSAIIKVIRINSLHNQVNGVFRVSYLFQSAFECQINRLQDLNGKN